MKLLKKYENWRVLSAIKKQPLPYSVWKPVSRLACVKHLSSVEKARLRILTSVLLEQKKFIGVQGLTLTENMKLIIAAQACVPVLKLGVNYYSGFVQVSIYPDAFWVDHKIIDASGILHYKRELLSGQSWSHGPVILSWNDIQKDMQSKSPQHNVIIHEFVHKIDMLNQGANGVPPISPSINSKNWGKVFRHAFAEITQQLQHHSRTRINAYSASSPAEFFAVVSEYFFMAPDYLHQHYPDVYKELKLFYK